MTFFKGIYGLSNLRSPSGRVQCAMPPCMVKIWWCKCCTHSITAPDKTCNVIKFCKVYCSIILMTSWFMIHTCKNCNKIKNFARMGLVGSIEPITYPDVPINFWERILRENQYFWNFSIFCSILQRKSTRFWNTLIELPNGAPKTISLFFKLSSY